jgi:hypothetical protein
MSWAITVRGSAHTISRAWTASLPEAVARIFSLIVMPMRHSQPVTFDSIVFECGRY